MSPTISVILPVHNAESSVSRRLEELLDVLPDLVPNFEVLVVDNGSTDQTEEVAHDLARSYPQVQVVRVNCRLELSDCVRCAMDRAAGNVVLVQDTAVRTGDLQASVQAATVDAAPHDGRRLDVGTTPPQPHRRGGFTSHLRQIALNDAI